MPSLMGDFVLLVFTVLVGCQDPQPGSHRPAGSLKVGTFEIKGRMSQSSLSVKERKPQSYFLKLKGSLM